MTSHGWLLFTLFLPFVLTVGLVFTDSRVPHLPAWLLIVIGVILVLRLAALIMVWRLIWRGVLLGLIPTGVGFLLLIADNLGLMPPAPPPNQTVIALNLGIILLNAGYWAAAYAARQRRA